MVEQQRFADLDALTLEDKRQGPKTRPRFLLVVFHGFGASAEDLLPLAPAFARAMPDTAQVFLQAPDPCLVGGSVTGRAWFPLQMLSYEEVVSGLKKVESPVSEALDALSAHYEVPTQRIALFGFSQGGMVALHATCNAVHPRKPWLATVGVSTRFVALQDLQGENLQEEDLRAGAPRRSTPLMMIHGDQDTVVPFEQGWDTASMLRKAGYDLTWITREGLGHAIDEAALQSACDFLGQHVYRIQAEQTQTERAQKTQTERQTEGQTERQMHTSRVL